MSNLPRLEEYLKASNDKFEIRKSLLIFKNLHYRATGEKVVEGFRYFNCDIGQLLAAFNAQDFQAISKLPFALDDEGEPDTSAVLLDLAYTESGAFVAAQPVEYKDHNPTPVAPVLLIEGPQAKSLFETVKQLDQSS
jgi:hypothetical protein